MGPAAEGLVVVRRALVSVDDPRGLVPFGRSLLDAGVELLATEGTRRRLHEGGVPARPAEELTGIGAWFGGRIKTLHPGLLGGILAPRTADGLAELERRGLLPIDLVAVNFYPFARRLGEDPRADDLEEFVDVGGVTLARAAAKNHAWVAGLTDPGQYGAVQRELTASGGALSLETRRALAVAAFERTAAYDALIARGIRRAPAPTEFPDRVVLQRESVRLRYGENPHQAAAVYRMEAGAPSGFRAEPFELLKGDALSFTNLLDLETAVATVAEFTTPTAAVVKHATPIGVASSETVTEAIARAVGTDPVARYGCVVAVNRPLTPTEVAPFHGVFVDLLAAPEVEAGAAELLAARRKLKVVRTGPRSLAEPTWEAHSALGRVLLQESDRRELDAKDLRLVTSRPATDEEQRALQFAWRVVRHAKSNAIVLARGSATVGMGSGQPTRVKAVELAVGVAGPRAAGSVLASDAFFPFPDGMEVAARAGVTAVIQPGGSLRDREVIEVAERHGISMYLTGWRVFRH
ncbi:MAG TPA: bifunctional phosphoribosylaminoimidazolecarboxamide formyltransferase/IMP cyclohydrolase [Thermoplasmata archaeon]|nr:bifunctional phosphoribosylaminoimidazolecarboxamide formyltransferase/IMP cyclohydrolase [Thermoplasmata archaeon]